MKWLGFGATNISHATKLIGSKLAKKSDNTQLFYIMCYVALIIMSWSDPCGNCGQHRADCDCKHYACVKEHTCEYCKNDCKKKSADGKEYGSCEDFVLATRNAT
jgi:hypothetical protein